MSRDIINQFTLLRKGEEHAFRYFYEKYYHTLCLCVLHILKDEEHMHDIVQDTFITLWKSRETLESELHLKMFLYQVVRHRCLNVLKNQKIKEKYANEYLAQENEGFDNNQVIEEEVHRLIIQEVEKLPEEQRRVVLLHLEGKDNAEIASMMHISVNTVKTHKARARKTLKTKLDYLLLFFIFGTL